MQWQSYTHEGFKIEEHDKKIFNKDSCQLFRVFTSFIAPFFVV